MIFPISLYPATKISSAMPTTFSISLNISLIFAGTYHLLGLLQMVAIYTCIYQTGMQMLLGKMTFYLSTGYGTQSWHL